MFEIILSHFSIYLVYIYGLLLSVENRNSQTAISKLTNKSRGVIMRILRKDIDFDKLFMKIIRILKINLKNGNFSIDETIYSKPHTKEVNHFSTLFSPANKSFTSGFKVLLLTWTNGKITLPVSFKIWHKFLGKTQLDIALELIKYAQKICNSLVLSICFDAYYNKRKILSYCQQYHIFYVTRLEKSRNVVMDKQQIKLKSIQFNGRYLPVFLPGVGNVWITKYKKKYYCSNRCPEYQRQLYEWYAKRWTIECVFRFVKSELGFEDCQSTKEVQHINHIGFCFLAYAILVAIFPDVNVYEAKRKFRSKLLNQRFSLKKQASKLIA